jgi:hypothetical protein
MAARLDILKKSVEPPPLGMDSPSDGADPAFDPFARSCRACSKP